MSANSNPSSQLRLKHVGVDSFFAERTRLLNSYDHAKAQSADDAVKTAHGVEGEAEIRRWLRTFLPKRFGVCKGYIITTNLQFEGPLEEWDVLVYDEIESPILFTRGADDAEPKRAIPVEHVHAAIEVKATLNPENAKKVAAKLLKLKQYIGEDISPEYPHFLSSLFVCAAVFLETKVESFAQYRSALDHLAGLYQVDDYFPFMGALVLRSQKQADHSGYLQLTTANEPFPMPDVFEHSSPFQLPNGLHGLFGTFAWAVNHYPTFLFDFLAFIKGTRTNRVSSFYGMDFEKPQGSRLFH